MRTCRGVQCWTTARLARRPCAQQACELTRPGCAPIRADTALDALSLQLLGDEAPEDLTIELQPSVRLLRSDWPVAALQAAHRLPQDQHVSAAARALQEGERGSLVIWRSGWEIRTQALPEDWRIWMGTLEAPSAPASAPDAAPSSRSLARLLTEAPTEFDFTNWLTAALREGWLWRVRKLFPELAPRLTTP